MRTARATLIATIFFIVTLSIGVAFSTQVSVNTSEATTSQNQPTDQPTYRNDNSIQNALPAVSQPGAQIPAVPKWFQVEVTRRRAGSGEKTTNDFITELWNTIWEISTRYEIDPLFITAVIALESNFRNVKGSGGVLGMMQILPSTAKIIAQLTKLEQPKDWNELLTNHRLNITYGTAYLSYLFKQTGSLSKALERYNNGPKKEIYAQNVMSLYEKYRNMHLQETSGK